MKRRMIRLFWPNANPLYLTAIFNGQGFREVLGLSEYLQLWWGFGELSRKNCV
jgi:hypothetical protein